MLRMAIIGVGWAGERQIQAVRELNGPVSVTCLVDQDGDLLAAKAAEYGISTTYRDYAAALADPDIDAVSICTPHALHCEMTLDAARAGKHILCEKPLALNLHDADRMIEAARQNNVKLYVAENWSYTPLALFLREMVQTKRYTGSIIHVSGIFGFQAREFGYAGRRAWLTLPDQGGTGTWMLHGIHTIAQIRSIFGEINEVYALENRSPLTKRTDIEASVSVLMRLESGVMFSLLQTSEVRLDGDLWGYVIHGDSGSVRAGRERYEIISEATGWQCVLAPYPPVTYSDYALEIAAFADYVLANQPGPTTGESERQSLAVVLAVYQSMQTRQPVIP